MLHFTGHADSMELPRVEQCTFQVKVHPANTSTESPELIELDQFLAIAPSAEDVFLTWLDEYQRASSQLAEILNKRPKLA